MKALFDFEQQRTFGRAALFYIGHFLIAVVSAGLAGALAGAHSHNISLHSAASSAGQLVALIYSSAICVSVINQRRLSYRYYAALLIVLPAAFLLGAFGGLLIPAALTMRTAVEAGVPSNVRSRAHRTFAARAPGTPFGRRSPNTR